MEEKLIAFVFIVESCKGVINLSIIHKKFVNSFEKQSCVIAGKNVSKRWAKMETHSHAMYLMVHYIIESEFNEGSSRLYQLTKIASGKGGGVSSPLY